MKIPKNFWSDSILHLYITFCTLQSVFRGAISFILQDDLARQVLLSPLYTDEEIEAWRDCDLQAQIAYKMEIQGFRILSNKD